MQEVEKTTVKRQQSMKRQHRRTRHKGGYIILVICLVAGIAVSLAVTRLFNVSRVTIHNTTNVPDEEIIAICGFENGDNMMRMNLHAMEKRIEEQIVYAKDVSVRKELPSTIVISVEKAEPAVNIQFEDGWLLISDSGRILEYLSDAPREGLLVVKGYPAQNPAVGDKLHANDTRQDNVLHQLMKAVMEAENPEIGTVDMTDINEIKVYIGQNITFLMGDSNDAVYKLKFAAQTVSRISQRKKYNLKMVGNNQISVVPEDETIRQTEPPAEEPPAEHPAENPSENPPEDPVINRPAENPPADDPTAIVQQDNGQPADNGQPEDPVINRPVDNNLQELPDNNNPQAAQGNAVSPNN